MQEDTRLLPTQQDTTNAADIAQPTSASTKPRRKRLAAPQQRWWEQGTPFESCTLKTFFSCFFRNTRELSPIEIVEKIIQEASKSNKVVINSILENKLTTQQLKTLVSQLSTNTALTSLTLHLHRTPSPEVIDQLIHYLNQNTIITYINIQYPNLSKAVLAQLTAPSRRNVGIQELFHRIENKHAEGEKIDWAKEHDKLNCLFERTSSMDQPVLPIVKDHFEETLEKLENELSIGPKGLGARHIRHA